MRTDKTLSSLARDTYIHGIKPLIISFIVHQSRIKMKAIIEH